MVAGMVAGADSINDMALLQCRWTGYLVLGTVLLSSNFTVVLACYRLSVDSQDGPYLHRQERPEGKSRQGSWEVSTCRRQFGAARTKVAEQASAP
ncbi:UNVERIFIED_ORG: hypothetical protein ABIB19_003190 [Arthrobacter sp. UYEF10]